jgi:hypothetical protein
MHPDLFLAWVESDRLLAARLEQHPDSSSIELAKDLAAETGLSQSSAFEVVHDYLFRKAIDTSEADWRFVRSLWPQVLQGALGFAAGIGLLHLMKSCLPPPMFGIILHVWALLVLGIMVLQTARDRSASRRRDDPGW